MQCLCERFVRDESGATAIEYGLICSLIAVAIIAILTETGTELVKVFTKVKTNLKS